MTQPNTDAYKEGQQAYKTGVELNDNPHEPGTEKSWDWVLGWLYAEGK